MLPHKFKVGAALRFSPHRVSSGAGPCTCKVVRLLSSDGSEPQYRIKCSTESYERVVVESELS